MIFSCILSITLGLVLVVNFLYLYWSWCHDFQNRVMRDHPLSPSNPKKPGQRKLDMDHVYLSFLDYSWVSVFVGNSAMFQWIWGFLVLKFREKFLKKHWIQTQPDYAALCGQLALETHFAINFSKFVEESDDAIAHAHDVAAEFCIEDFPYVINNSQVGKEELELKQEKLRLLIALKKKEKLEGHRLLKAWIGEKELTAQETYMFMSLRIFTSGHAQIHALANWAVNPQNFANPFLRRMSIITVVYNYYGLNVFNRVVLFLQSFCKPFNHIHKDIPAKSESEGHSHQKAQGHIHLFNMGMKSGVKHHSRSVQELMPYSSFVTFIVKVRKIFHEEFKRYENDFPGIDVEALFNGTVMHSLDHTQAGDITKDPLWFRSNNNRDLKPEAEQDNSHYEWMEEFCRFARCGFVDDLPGLLFNYRFKDAPHPFFKKVYNFAYKINPYLADSMDCCIIK